MRQDASSCAISSMEYVKIKLKVEKCIELQKLGQGPFKTCFFKKCIQYSKISSLFLDYWLHQQFRYSWKENQKNSASIIFSKWDYSSTPFLKLEHNCNLSQKYYLCELSRGSEWWLTLLKTLPYWLALFVTRYASRCSVQKIANY